jgi:hypothetical protein
MTREDLIEAIIQEITNRTYRRVGRGIGTVAGGVVGGYTGGLYTILPMFGSNPTKFQKAGVMIVPGVGGAIGGNLGGEAGEALFSRFGTGKEAEERWSNKPEVYKRRGRISTVIGAATPYLAAGAVIGSEYLRKRPKREPAGFRGNKNRYGQR